MAGSDTYTTFSSGAIYHQGSTFSNGDPTPNDYNDMVLVPKKVLIDTADAIRLRCKGKTEIYTIVNDNNPNGIVAPAMNNTGIVTNSKSNISGIEPEDFASVLNSMYLPTLAQRTDEFYGYGNAGNTGTALPSYVTSGSTITGIKLGTTLTSSGSSNLWKSLWTTIACPGWYKNTDVSFEGPVVIIFTRNSALNAARKNQTYFSADLLMSCGSPTSSTYSFGKAITYPYLGIKIADVLPAKEGGSDSIITQFNLYKRNSYSGTTFYSGGNSKFGTNGVSGRYSPAFGTRGNTGLY